MAGTPGEKPAAAPGAFDADAFMAKPKSMSQQLPSGPQAAATATDKAKSIVAAIPVASAQPPPRPEIGAAPPPTLLQRLEGVLIGTPENGATAIGRAMGYNFDAPTENRPAENLLQPEATLPTEKGDNALVGGTRGALKVVGQLTNAPNMLMLAGSGGIGMLGKVSTLLPRAVSAGFSVQMLRDAYNQIPEVKHAWDSGDPAAVAEAITKLAASAIMGGAAGVHAVHGGAPVVTDSRTEINTPEAKTEATAPEAKEAAAPTAAGGFDANAFMAAEGQQRPTSTAATPERGRTAASADALPQAAAPGASQPSAPEIGTPGSAAASPADTAATPRSVETPQPEATPAEEQNGLFGDTHDLTTPRVGREKSPEAGTVAEIPTGDIHVDAPRFQFKSNVGAGGAGEEFRGVTKFDPEKSGIISVWRDPEDGKVYVVNGHHRVEMAQRLGAPSLTARFLDAGDAQEARTKGALINIAEGRGDSLDAAKVFRDSGMDEMALQREGISLVGEKAKEGMALANLDPHLFSKVVSGDLPKARGAVIGEGLKNPVDQRQLYDLLQASEKNGKRVTNEQVGEMIRLAKGETDQHTETQENLFGSEEATRSLIKEKAEVSEYVQRRMAQEKRLFQAVGSETAASRLGETGNVIKAGANAEVAERTGQAHALYQKLSTMSGPVSDALNAAAGKIAKGDNSNGVKESAYGQIKSTLLEQAARLTGESRAPGERSEGNGGGGAAQTNGAENRPAGSTSPAGQVGKLPRELAGAAPRYAVGAHQFQVSFESDVDKAAYIAAQKVRSKRDASYLKFAMDQTGLSESHVRAEGHRLKSSLGSMARAAIDGGDTSEPLHMEKRIPLKGERAIAAPPVAKPAIRETPTPKPDATPAVKESLTPAAAEPAATEARPRSETRKDPLFQMGGKDLQDLATKGDQGAAAELARRKANREGKAVQPPAEPVQGAAASGDTRRPPSNVEAARAELRTRIAGKLRDGADSLQKQIDAKRDPAIGHQNLTARRARIAEGMGKDADRIEDSQKRMRALADLNERGEVPQVLSRINNRATLDELRPGFEGAKPEYRNRDAERLKSAGINAGNFDEAAQAVKDLDTAKRVKSPEQLNRELERGLVGKKIEGFFPTPKPVVDRMLDEAQVKPGMSVLEPSAGKGDIADAARDRGAKVTAVETHPDLRSILEAKGHELGGRDFLEHKGQTYDRIVMNPPFERGQDIDHVQHAYDLLKPGGRVVSLMSEGPFFRDDAKSRQFREWLDQVGGDSEKLDSGSFKGKDSFRQTGVNGRMVTIDRPNTERGSFSNKRTPTRDDASTSMFGEKDQAAQAQEQADKERLEGERLTAQFRAPVTREEQVKRLKPDKTERQSDMFGDPDSEANAGPRQGGLFGDERGSFSGKQSPPPPKGGFESYVRNAFGEMKDLKDKRDLAQAELERTKATPGDQEFGRRVIESFTGERDLWAARVNQAVEKLRRIVPKAADQEGLALLREYRGREDELADWLSDRPPLRLDMNAGDHAAAMRNIERMRPAIESALHPTPAMRAADQVLTKIANQTLREGQRLGFLESRWTPEQYTPHILHPKGEGQVPTPVGDRLGRALGGKIGKHFAFAETRDYPTLLDAVADNVKPKTLNALDAFTIHGDSFATARATHLLVNQIKDTGVGMVEGNRAKRPRGWVELAPHSPEFRTPQQFLSPEGEPTAVEVPLVVPKYISDALRPITDPEYLGTLAGFRKLRVFQAYTKSVQLGLSMFHATTENYMAAANMGVRGWAKGLMADRTSPDFLNEERDLIAHGGTSPVQGQTVEAYKHFEPGSIPTWSDIWRKAPGAREMDRIATGLTDFTFGKLQRQFKVTDYAMHKAAWIGDHPHATPEDRTAAMQSIAKEVNATYGGLHWENLRVNRSSVEVARALMLAPDWTFSNVFNVKYALERGTPAGKMARAFWTRNLVGGMAATQVASLMWGGKPSPNPTQVYMGKDRDGKDVYQNLFFKGASGDVINLVHNVSDFGALQGLARTIAGKAAPLVRAGAQLYGNRDYLGHEIVQRGMNPVAATGRAAFETAKALAPVPVSVQNIYDMLVGPKGQQKATHYSVPEVASTIFAGNPPRHIPPPNGIVHPKLSLIDQLRTGRVYKGER